MENNREAARHRSSIRHRINNPPGRRGLIETISIRVFSFFFSIQHATRIRETTIFQEERENIEATMFTQPDYSQFSRRISRRETILFLSSLSLSLPLSPSWPLAYCLFTGQHRPPLIKPRDGWAVKLYKLLISRETYTSRRDVARNRRKVILLSSFLSSFLPLLFLLSIYRATDQPTRPNPTQPGSSSHGSL